MLVSINVFFRFSLMILLFVQLCDWPVSSCLSLPCCDSCRDGAQPSTHQFFKVCPEGIVDPGSQGETLLIRTFSYNGPDLNLARRRESIPWRLNRQCIVLAPRLILKLSKCQTGREKKLQNNLLRMLASLVFRGTKLYGCQKCLR